MLHKTYMKQSQEMYRKAAKYNSMGAFAEQKRYEKLGWHFWQTALYYKELGK